MQPLTHIPVLALHMGVPPEHPLPQRPQLAVLERGASHPLEATRSQSAKPAMQLFVHAPLLHVAV